MPQGSLIRDYNAANLLAGATIDSAATSNATAVQVDRPAEVEVRLETGTVTGTNPTITITLKGCDSSSFGSAVVTYGVISLASGNAASQSSKVKVMRAAVYHKYVRASVVTAGTSPVYTGSTLALTPVHYKQTPSTDSAAV